MIFFQNICILLVIVSTCYAFQNAANNIKPDCSAPSSRTACNLVKRSRVYFDSQAKECKLLEKGQCADGANKFTTLSACKIKCIPNKRSRSNSTLSTNSTRTTRGINLSNASTSSITRSGSASRSTTARVSNTARSADSTLSATTI